MSIPSETDLNPAQPLRPIVLVHGTGMRAQDSAPPCESVQREIGGATRTFKRIDFLLSGQFITHLYVEADRELIICANAETGAIYSRPGSHPEAQRSHVQDGTRYGLVADSGSARVYAYPYGKVSLQTVSVCAVRTWGQHAQLAQLAEECSELAAACNHVNRGRDVEGFIGELADVRIMLTQAEHIAETLGCLPALRVRLNNKLQRLAARLVTDGGGSYEHMLDTRL